MAGTKWNRIEQRKEDVPGRVDETLLIYDFPRAAAAASSMHELCAAWAKYVTPAPGMISDETLTLLIRIYSLRASTICNGE